MRRSKSHPARTAWFIVAGLVSWAFVGAWWFLLWRKSVRWTGERVGYTVGATFGASCMPYPELATAHRSEQPHHAPSLIGLHDLEHRVEDAGPRRTRC